tara:strand:- start:940 stop:1155 length:216 start_codon:yes stop_codon:yes gene_type:complete
MENEKMKLYKVTFEKNGNFENHFIIATNENRAILKANEFRKLLSPQVYCDFICNRDVIIPTVEPIQEFKNQ